MTAPIELTHLYIFNGYRSLTHDLLRSAIDAFDYLSYNRFLNYLIHSSIREWLLDVTASSCALLVCYYLKCVVAHCVIRCMRVWAPVCVAKCVWIRTCRREISSANYEYMCFINRCTDGCKNSQATIVKRAYGFLVCTLQLKRFSFFVSSSCRFKIRYKQLCM